MSTIKVPPHNEEAEQSVLGAILIDKEAISVVSGILRPEHFYSDLHALIYIAMLDIHEERKPIDVLTVSAQIKKHDKNKTVRSSYLNELVNAVPTAANVEEYSHLVKDLATKRALIHAASEIAELGFEEDKEVKDLLDRAESSIFTISQSSIKRDFIAIKDTLTESFDRLDELHRLGEGLRGTKTGFSDLDRILSGMQKSNLLILAARPGQGKTALVVNIAQFIGVMEKKAVAIFSLEMSKEELVDRLMVGQADIDAWKQKTGRLNEEDWTKLSNAMGELAEAPIFIDDTPGISIAEMRSKARRLQLEHKDLSLIIVDYLQLVDPGQKFEGRVQEVAHISKSLKNLARELNVPVLAASQLSRAVEQRTDRKPQLADLRESGTIEQDADVVMFIYRPDIEGNPINIPTKLLIAKHRNGATGEIDLLFRGDRIKFYSVERQQQV